MKYTLISAFIVTAFAVPQYNNVDDYTAKNVDYATTDYTNTYANADAATGQDQDYMPPVDNYSPQGYAPSSVQDDVSTPTVDAAAGSDITPTAYTDYTPVETLAANEYYTTAADGTVYICEDDDTTNATPTTAADISQVTLDSSDCTESDNTAVASDAAAVASPVASPVASAVASSTDSTAATATPAVNDILSNLTAGMTSDASRPYIMGGAVLLSALVLL